MLDVTDFGAVGDGVTDDGPAFRAALAAVTTFIADHPIGFNPDDKGDSLYIPPTRAAYRIVDDLVISRPIRIFGDYGATRSTSAALMFESNTNGGIVCNAPCVLQNLYIFGGDDGLNDVPGVLAHRRVIMERCSVIGWGSHGMEVNGTGDDLNANACVISCSWFENNRGWGLYVHGNNSNGCLDIANTYMSNLLGGSYDSAFLGMTHIAPLAEANGSVGGETNVDVNAFKSDQNGNTSTWIGAYAESGQNVLSFHDDAIVIGGTNMIQTWGASTGMLIGKKGHVKGFTLVNSLEDDVYLVLNSRANEVFNFSGEGDTDEFALKYERDAHQFYFGHPTTPRIMAFKTAGDSRLGAGSPLFEGGLSMGTTNAAVRVCSRASYPADEGTDPPPFGGSWHDGDRIYNNTPSAGGYSGWIRVSSVWKGFGLIES